MARARAAESYESRHYRPVMRIALPEPQYLEAIGRYAYAVSYLEWSILGDLPHVEGLPATLTVDELASKTTGGIGHALLRHAPDVNDSSTREWLEAGGRALVELTEARNALLHARPATIEGKQRLFRWLPGTAFAITDEWLAAQERNFETLADQVRRLRVHRPME